MYNMKFKTGTNAEAMSFIAGLELTQGVTVHYGKGGWVYAYGLSAADRDYIERNFYFKAL